MPSGTASTQLTLALCCFLGSFVLYLLNRLDRRQPFSLLQAIRIDVSHETGKPSVILLDMVISSALGGIVVMLIAVPTTTVQAVISGLGMTGLLSVHARGGRNNGRG